MKALMQEICFIWFQLYNWIIFFIWSNMWILQSPNLIEVIFCCKSMNVKKNVLKNDPDQKAQQCVCVIN